MAYLAQNEGVQKQMSSFRLTAVDSRESKRDDAKRSSSTKSKGNILLSKDDASFSTSDVVGRMTPVNGEYERLYLNSFLFLEQNVLVKQDNQRLWVTRSTADYARTTQIGAIDHLQVRWARFHYVVYSLQDTVPSFSTRMRSRTSSLKRTLRTSERPTPKC